MVKDIALFVLGAATGFGIASMVLKKKYEEILEEEIASVKKVYADSNEEKKEEPEEASSESSEEEVTATYKDITNQYKADTDEDRNTDIYVIKPEEYGMENDYELVGLRWYANHILVNENGEVMDNDDIEIAVGDTSFVEFFGEYEEDEVCVRNETLKIDYQIIYMDEDYDEE